MTTETPLEGIRVIEMAGLAPAPYAGMILADFGASVLRIDRPGGAAQGGETRFNPARDCLSRGKRSIGLDIKTARGLEILLELIEGADVLLEPFRPGVMERLGLGPAETLARNPRLVYARLTGWGQDGPYAGMAGHDIDYIALSGVLSAIGRRGQRPLPPLNLLGDFAGGGMLCALGIVLALFERERSGKGQVVDSAMVDGAANLASFIFGMRQGGVWENERGDNLLDSGAPFYDVYETADGGFLAVGALEPQFYAVLTEGLGLAAEELPAQMNRSGWPQLRERFTEVFLAKTRDQWCEIFDGTDACVAPVLGLDEAGLHKHNKARGTFVPSAGESFAPGPAPRLSRTPGRALPEAALAGQHNSEVLGELGLDQEQIQALVSDGVVG